MELLTKVKNSYDKFPETEEYLDQSQLNHSNRKDFNYDEDYLHQFLRDDLTNALANYKGQYKNLVIVSPQQYQEQISKFSDSLKSHFSKIQTMYLTTDKTSEMLYEHLSEMLRKQIEEYREVTKNELSSPSKKLQTDTKSILKAAENGQVETLFVVPNYHTAGFVSDEDNTSKTNQTQLHIIQKVIEFGGKVVPISSDLLDQKSSAIFAVLRF
jgi:hypothetical protein